MRKVWMLVEKGGKLWGAVDEFHRRLLWLPKWQQMICKNPSTKTKPNTVNF